MNSLSDSALILQYSSSVDDFNDHAWTKRERDRPTALELATKAEQLAHNQGNVQGAAHSLVVYAFVAFRENH